ncbi:spexin [Varanus komodoensis]|uniref:spexin n=1 Tax=Varanus komodoensis TaxID=61221 RepID=UPI001CF784CC|nr:spexin [Varanus komodoensis]
MWADLIWRAAACPPLDRAVMLKAARPAYGFPCDSHITCKLKLQIELMGLHGGATAALALLLSASLLTVSWSIPQGHFQRRNWTPQAMLYLKGAQGRRFVSEESQRKDLFDRLQLETRSQNMNPLTLSEAAALFLSSLRKAQDEADEEEANEKPGYVADGLLNW